MSRKQRIIPEAEGLPPLAAGLSDDDITELLALVRTVTKDKILEIRSDHNDAEVRTGFLADGECGSGHHFFLMRTEKGWSFRDQSEWIS